MPYNYFYIRYVETRSRSHDAPGGAFYYSAELSTIDTIKTFIRNVVLKNPAASVSIFSLQPLERDEYLAKGGTMPSE